MASSSHFSAKDVFGQIVQVNLKRWNNYVLRKRPHFAGQEQLVIDAVENPDTVHQGNTPDHKMFKGQKQPGQGFHFGNASVVVVVWYPPGRNEGHLTTVYTTPDAPKGKVLWKHP